MLRAKMIHSLAQTAFVTCSITPLLHPAHPESAKTDSLPLGPRRASVAARSGCPLLSIATGHMGGVRIDAPLPESPHPPFHPLLHPPVPRAAISPPQPPARQDGRLTRGTRPLPV